jgi:hypothetical protein
MSEKMSPDHGEIDPGGMATVRKRALEALEEVAVAAYDYLYNSGFSGWSRLVKLKDAVDKLDAEVGSK